MNGNRKRRRPSPAFVLAAVALAVALGGVAYAAIPDGSGVFNACYDNTTGAVRLVNKQPGDCAGTETGASWSQTGPAGPRGPVGPRGPSDAYVAQRNGNFGTASLSIIRQVAVPAGSYVIQSKVTAYSQRRQSLAAECVLDTVSGGARNELDDSLAFVGAQDHSGSSLQVVDMGSTRLSDGATVRLLCDGRNLRNARLQAIRVGNLTG